MSGRSIFRIMLTRTLIYRSEARMTQTQRLLTKGNHQQKFNAPVVTFALRPFAVSTNSAPTSSNLCSRFFHTSCSLKCSTLSPSSLKKAMESLTDQFMEARELLDDARESMGTVYFSDDMSDAQGAVKDTLEQYQQLLAQLSQAQKQEVLRTIGLKMEELKAQEDAIREMLQEDH